MKKFYIFLLLLISTYANSQIVNIPDANFKEMLLIPSAGIDTNNDGEIQVSEAEAADEIFVFENNIVSMEGLQYFINITKLVCDKNQIEILDVSQNTKLESLFCNYNHITTLDFSQNPNLLFLWVSNNPLNSLNISQNLSLIEIAANDSLLTEIDVTNKPDLVYLDVYNMKLTNLDLSQNPKLLILFAFNNELSSVNVKNGNNENIVTMLLGDNPDLECIEVDDVNYANSQICDSNNGWCKDAIASYSEDCQLGTDDFSTVDFQLFPNPAGNLLKVQSKENIENVKIYSAQGFFVKEATSKTIDVSQLSSGMYFAQITSNGKSFTKKFIKE